MSHNTRSVDGRLGRLTIPVRRYPLRSSLPVVSLMAAAVLLASGCTIMRQDINTVDFHEKIKNVETGKTTTDELQDMIGSPPQSILYVAGGERIWVYSFGQAKTAGITLIVFNTLKTNIGLDGALFLIDESGVIKEYTVSNNSQALPWEWWPFDEEDES